MRSIVTDYLTDALRDVCDDDGGAVAGYIPELEKAEPGMLAAAFATIDGVVYSAGDVDVEFTIQSISKPFVYALSLDDRGFAEVLTKVGVEPSGEAFNQISFEAETGRPRNPMINAGAIATHALAGDPSAASEDRVARIVTGLSAFAGRGLVVDEAVCVSELRHAHRNLAIAHMLRGNGVIAGDEHVVVEGYTRQCAALVTTRDLAVMAATLANHGVNPVTGDRVVSERAVRQTLSVMSTCGMYDSAGDWATQVGIPAKSGVAGGLIGALPGQVGIATFSPRLDSHGNSVRGVSLFERFSNDMGLHVMSVPPSTRATIRSAGVVGAVEPYRVIELQGAMRFAAAERVAREFALRHLGERRIVLDLTLVSSIDDVAERMLIELANRLADEGHSITFVDPDGRIQVGDVDKGRRVRSVSRWDG